MVEILTPLARDESVDFFIEIDVGEGNGCKDDVVCFNIKGDGVTYVHVGARLTAVPLCDIP